MNTYIFKQMQFIRNQTLKTLDGVSENMALAIPEKFRNHILWQAGHIYLVQERFAFQIHGFDTQLPKTFMAWFGPGSTPLDWPENPPALAEIKEMLQEQPYRIEQSLKDRMNEKSPNPYTTSSGMTLENIGEFVNFSLYHEGMHFNAIKQYKVLLNK